MAEKDMVRMKDLKKVILAGVEKTNGSVPHRGAAGVSQGQTIQGHSQDFCLCPEKIH